MRRFVPSVFLRRGKRSNVERLRRSTVWSLIGGAPLAWFGVLAGLAESGARISIVPLVLGMLGLVAFTVLLVRIVRAAVAGTAANREIVVSAALVVALLLLEKGQLWSWGLLAPAWASAVALLLSGPGSIAASVGAAVAGLLLTPLGGGVLVGLSTEDSRLAVVGYFLTTVILPWTNRFQLWFWQVVRAAEKGKEAQARLAVTEERLRFSRDLHDLVGHSLSAIAVKSEVAVKLSSVDAGRAVAEMDEVRGLARQALKEIRTAVRGYRTVDLDAELRSMTAVLEAAGIRCTLETPRERVPDELATLLAWVVREGTTNVLRHSSATRCRIAVALRDGTAVLEMTNDGVAGTGGRGGTGLAGLSERLATVGGAVTVGGDGEFRLRATIPLEGMR
ncbi:histidine kinase [Streptosporangium subroseum]|uniref:sensor histidine kinase n=1 Tax=Streptosporangium subroseum TaxID=106412 RepID=UPI0034364FE1